MSDTNISNLRKRQFEPAGVEGARAEGEVDIANRATIAYSSENPAHPVEHMLDGSWGPGATRWISATSDVPNRLWWNLISRRPFRG
jgi:hypothetical protein